MMTIERPHFLTPQVDPNTKTCFTFMRLYDGQDPIVEGIVVSASATCTNQTYFKPGHEYWYSSKTSYSTANKKPLRLERTYGDVSGRDADVKKGLLACRIQGATWNKVAAKLHKPDLMVVDGETSFGLTLSFGPDPKGIQPVLFTLYWFHNRERNLFTGVETDKSWNMTSDMSGAPPEWSRATT